MKSSKDLTRRCSLQLVLFQNLMIASLREILNSLIWMLPNPTSQSQDGWDKNSIELTLQFLIFKARRLNKRSRLKETLVRSLLKKILKKDALDTKRVAQLAFYLQCRSKTMKEKILSHTQRLFNNQIILLEHSPCSTLGSISPATQNGSSISTQIHSRFQQQYITIQKKRDRLS